MVRQPVVPGFVIRHYRIIRCRAHSPRERICQTPSETAREPSLESRLKRMIVGVAHEAAAADRVVTREHRTQKDIRQASIAIRRIAICAVERSPCADWNRVDVRGKHLIVTPVSRIADGNYRAATDASLNFHAC